MPKNVVIIGYDVADVYADPKFDPLVRRQGFVLHCHPGLDFKRASRRRINGTSKLNQHTVARGLDDAPAMLGNRRVD